MAIAVLSLLGVLRVITPDTLGILEAALLCGIGLAAAGRYTGRPAGRLLLALVVGAAAAVIWLIRPVLFVYLPAVAVNLLLAGFFFSTLRPGSEPLVTRIARIEQPQFDAAVYAYTRGVTLAWALFFTALAAEALTLIAFAPVTVTLLFLNLVNYLLIAVFFVAEYLYRRVRLRRYPHMSPILLAARLTRRGIIGVIRYGEHAPDGSGMPRPRSGH